MNLERLPKYDTGCIFFGFGIATMLSSPIITDRLFGAGFYLFRLSGGLTFVMIGLLIMWFNSSIEHTLSKSLEEALQNKIDDLESQIAKKSTELEDLKLQRSLDNSGSTSGNGALSIVINMRTDGKTESEIARFLKNNGLSYSQVGVLLHDNPLNVTDSAISLHAKRLLRVV